MQRATAGIQRRRKCQPTAAGQHCNTATDGNLARCDCSDIHQRSKGSSTPWTVPLTEAHALLRAVNTCIHTFMQSMKLHIYAGYGTFVNADDAAHNKKQIRRHLSNETLFPIRHTRKKRCSRILAASINHQVLKLLLSSSSMSSVLCLRGLHSGPRPQNTAPPLRTIKNRDALHPPASTFLSPIRPANLLNSFSRSCIHACTYRNCPPEPPSN